MPRRRSKEGIQSNALEQMGLRQDVPSGEFGEQPDSGSRIGGVRGRQEFGIEGGISSELGAEAGSAETAEGRLVAEAQESASGFSELSKEGLEEQREEETEEEVAYRDEPHRYIQEGDLANLVRYRLRENKQIHLKSLRVSVQSVGQVSVSGRVRSEAEKLRVSEVVSALPGVQLVNNQLAVWGEH